MSNLSKKRMLEMYAKVKNLPDDPSDESNILAAVAAVKADTASISTAVVTTIPGTITALQASIDAGFALTGDAVVANVLTGKTFYKDNYQSKLTGTMPNNAGDVASVSGHMGVGTTLHVVPATGYTDGVDDATTIDLAVVDPDLVATNIATGVAVLGVTGTYDTSVTPITAATMKTGLEGWVNGSKVTGSGTQTLSNANDTVTAGYYEATTLSTVDADLAVGNIKTGVSIFGITGTYDTEAVAPIAAATVLADQVGFVNGAKVTGTMVNHTIDIEASSISNDGTTLKFTVPAGYYPGTVNVTYTDADFVATNIVSGVTIFGVEGSH